MALLYPLLKYSVLRAPLYSQGEKNAAMVEQILKYSYASPCGVTDHTAFGLNWISLVFAFSSAQAMCVGPGSSTASTTTPSSSSLLIAECFVLPRFVCCNLIPNVMISGCENFGR